MPEKNPITKVMIGIGNRHRRDDGVGLEIIKRLRRFDESLLGNWSLVTCEGDLLDLIDLISKSSHVVIMDGLISTSRVPGSIMEWDLLKEKLPLGVTPLSSHSMGLSSLIDLLAVLGKKPRYFRLIGLIVADSGYGDGLSPMVASALDQVVHKVLSILTEREIGEPIRS
jgi:hydrogenase maturation protease